MNIADQIKELVRDAGRVKTTCEARGRWNRYTAVFHVDGVGDCLFHALSNALSNATRNPNID